MYPARFTKPCRYLALMKLEFIEKNSYYHIYNRGINGCKIFKNNDNYIYFLKLFFKYLIPHITVLSYCLLNNHFHFVIRINDNEKIVTQKFSNFFNAYAKAFNKAHSRTGSLFEKHFKRKKIESEIYLRNLIIYVNTNPQKHGFTNNYESYNFSSFKEIIEENSELVNYSEVIKLFDNIDNFKYVIRYKELILSTKYTFE